VKLKTDWAQGWFYLGLLDYGSNRFDDAIDAFDRFLELNPDLSPALALRGLCEFEVGAYDNSLRDLDAGVKKGAADDPHNAQVIRYHYGQLLAHAGRFEEAFVQYQFFASLQIDDPDLRLGLGLAGTRSQMLPKDVPAPNRPLLEEAGGAAYTFFSGNTDGADTAFNQLFARYPKAPELHFFYATLLFRHGSDLAIEQFRDYLTAVPQDGFAHGMLAFSLMLADRFSEARPEAELAQSEAPTMEMAQIALARSLIETGSKPGTETGDDKRAAVLINRVLEQDPDNLEAHMALAALYSRTGDREDEDRERMVCHILAR
jgi:tetratricopeptide (TPR) repeat protein